MVHVPSSVADAVDTSLANNLSRDSVDVLAATAVVEVDRLNDLWVAYQTQTCVRICVKAQSELVLVCGKGSKFGPFGSPVVCRAPSTF